MNVQALLALLVVAVPCVWAACPPGTFQCGIRCIAEEYLCDGLQDCWGRELHDESQDTCKGECKPGATFCSKLDWCIPDWMQCNEAVLDGFDNAQVDCNLDGYLQNRARADCNGYDECTDERDELDCDSPERCAPTAFLCNGRCQPRYWLCDGVRQCRDVDDEANCTYSYGIPTTTARTVAPTTTARTEALTSNRKENTTDTPVAHEPVHIHGDVHAQMHVHVNAGVRRSAELCAPDGFVCDGGCWPRAWVCDGQRDCMNEDDEANCTDSDGTLTSTARTEAPTSTARTEAPTSTRVVNITEPSAVHGPVHIHGDIHGDVHVLHVHVNAGVRTGPGGGVPLLLVLVVLLL